MKSKVSNVGGRRWIAVLQRSLSLEFAGIAGVLATLLFSVGALVWTFERQDDSIAIRKGSPSGSP